MTTSDLTGDAAARSAFGEVVPAPNDALPARHRGLLTPGIRLFQRLGFAAKAMLISCSFLLPIGLLTTSFVSGTQRDLGAAGGELQGLAYQRELLALLRLALAQGDDVASKANLQFGRLRAQDLLHGQELGTAEVFKSVNEAMAELGKPAASQRETSQRLGELVDNLLDLSAQVGDSSGLTLDPEVATYYLVMASVVDGPDLLSQLGKLRQAGADALKAGAATPSQQRSLIRSQALAARLSGGIKAALAKVAKSDAATAERVAAAAAMKAVADFAALIDVGPLMAEGSKVDVKAYVAQADQAMDGLGAMATRGIDGVDSQLRNRISGLEWARNLVLVALLLSLLTAAYCFAAFYIVLKGGLKAVEAHLGAISRGDLSARLAPQGSDESAQLMHTLQDLQVSLSSMVTQVRDASDAVVRTSVDVSAGTLDLSTRTEQAAGSLQRAAAAMGELGVTVRSTADNAGHASALAADNAKAAERGGAVIGQVVATMQAIHGSSNKIGEIIATIDSIAFQTNILALNAAVEAARAGEQGRGFAVVASEVRMLAQRSAAAARQIKSLIQESVESVASGTEVVRGAGQTMQELLGNAHRMNALMAQIAQAAAQQSQGIAEVGEVVSDMDRLTQQNSALVQETTSATITLKDQAELLGGQVRRFVLPPLAQH